MSKYTPEILDRSLLALRAEIAQKSGDHKYFPRGYAFEGYSLWTVRPIPGVFIGWTTRFFIYLPPTPENANTGNTSIENLSWERCEMRLAGDRNGSTTIVGMRTAKGQFESVFRGMTSQSEATQPIKTDDLKGANCFSVALRVTNTDSIAVLINLKEVFRGTFDNLQDPNITWEFTFKTGSYSIFSWHTTDELKSSSTHWGNHLSMENFWCPTGTEATITVVALKDSDVVKLKVLIDQQSPTVFQGVRVKKDSTYHFVVTLAATTVYVETTLGDDKMQKLPSTVVRPLHYITPQFFDGIFRIIRIETRVSYYVPA